MGPSSYLPVETQRQSTVLRLKEKQQTEGRPRGKVMQAVEVGVIFTWWHHSIVEGRMVGTNRPHEAKHTAAKHGCQKDIKCSVEEKDEAWERERGVISVDI